MLRNNNFLIDDEVISQEQWQLANISLERHISFDYCEDIMKSYLSLDTQNCSESSNIEQSTHSNESVTRVAVSDHRKKVDYQKNICAYVTKKAVSCLLAAPYRRIVEKICSKNQCSYSQIKEYYGQKMQQVFGITLLAILITPQNEEELKIKTVFRAFLKWFLREKYMFYLLKYGKMEDKDKYIEFKNKYLLYIEQAPISFLSESNLN